MKFLFTFKVFFSSGVLLGTIYHYHAQAYTLHCPNSKCTKVTCDNGVEWGNGGIITQDVAARGCKLRGSSLATSGNNNTTLQSNPSLTAPEISKSTSSPDQKPQGKINIQKDLP